LAPTNIFWATFVAPRVPMCPWLFSYFNIPAPATDRSTPTQTVTTDFSLGIARALAKPIRVSPAAISCAFNDSPTAKLSPGEI
jgi:hypothetical protein